MAVTAVLRDTHCKREGYIYRERKLNEEKGILMIDKVVSFCTANWRFEVKKIKVKERTDYHVLNYRRFVHRFILYNGGRIL